jgi:hypothetical protein
MTRWRIRGRQRSLSASISVRRRGLYVVMPFYSVQSQGNAYQHSSQKTGSPEASVTNFPLQIEHAVFGASSSLGFTGPS